MMHGKGLAFAGVCLRAWRRLCTQQTGWPAEKAALEQALRVAQTSKDTEVRRVEKLQWEARLEAQARAARAAPHRTSPYRTDRKAAHRPRPRAPARACTQLHRTQPVRSAPCRARRTPVRPAAPPCRRASPSSSMLCASASSRAGTARGTPSCTPRSAGARTPRAARRSHHCAHQPQERGWQRAGSLRLPRPPRPHAGVHSSHL